MQASILSLRGAIWRHPRLQILRIPILAFLYSCLLAWANAIEKGLNPPCSFNSVSVLRNRPPRARIVQYSRMSKLFPCRPVGAYGIIGPFPQVGTQKGSLRTKEFGGRYSRFSLMVLLYGDAETASGGTRQHQNASSEASSRYSHSVIKICTAMLPRLCGVSVSTAFTDSPRNPYLR